ncbi:DUF4880 domain-containing protein [Ralstonia insidiosa]|nr:DUF4880 domain-containing protein [Ralstonia insidiosa]
MKAAPEPLKTTLKIPHTLRRDAHAWVRRLTSGEATVADAQALKRWCDTSDAHAAAFAEARQLWKDFGPAGEAVRRRQAARTRRAPTLGRRAFLGALLRRRPALPWLWLRRLACGVRSPHWPQTCAPRLASSVGWHWPLM